MTLAPPAVLAVSKVLRIPRHPAARGRLALTGALGAVRTWIEVAHRTPEAVKPDLGERLAICVHALILPQVAVCQPRPWRSAGKYTTDACNTLRKPNFHCTRIRTGFATTHTTGGGGYPDPASRLPHHSPGHALTSPRRCLAS